jgi:glycosyltransferase involved in cell wall biosynthesis
VSANQHEAIGYRADRRSVIPNGFDCERFQPDTGARASVRAELGLDEETPLIGLIARYHPMKDHANFLAAARLVLKQEPTAHFLLAGPCVEVSTKELSTLVSTLGLQGRIHLLGERSDIPRLTAALDIACSSSAWGEGFPNVIGEAMACGVPCVVTDVGDSAWIVGETGFVVSPKSPQELAESLQKAIGLEEENKLDREMIRQRIIDSFSLSTFVEKTADVLEKA